MFIQIHLYDGVVFYQRRPTDTFERNCPDKVKCTQIECILNCLVCPDKFKHRIASKNIKGFAKS